MRLGHFYKLIVKFGKDHDPRPRNSIISYEDTAILYGKPGTEVKKIMAGIDIEVGDLVLADRLRQLHGLDLVVAHHPEGKAFAGLHQVMRLQVDMLAKLGVSRRVAQEMMDERSYEVERGVLPQNHMRAVDAARLLNLPFICAHTPADNHVAAYLQALMNKEKPKTVQDIIKILTPIPEYQDAIKINAGPRIIAGNPNRAAGRVFVEMTGGTEGSREAFDKVYKAGVRTLVCMHLSEAHLKKVKDNNLNVVIAGHISSDNLGLNLLFDRIEKEERLDFIDSSGFRRIRR